MTGLLLAAIDGQRLAQAVLVCVVSGLGVCVAFSLLVYGSARLEETRRTGERHVARAVLYGAIAAVGAAGTVGAVALAILVVLE